MTAHGESSTLLRVASAEDRLVSDQLERPMRRIGAYEAKTHLPRLLDDVAEGEAITITKHGVAIAVLGPVAPRPTRTVHEAIAALRAFRRAHPLAGISLRELIDEGRR